MSLKWDNRLYCSVEKKETKEMVFLPRTVKNIEFLETLEKCFYNLGMFNIIFYHEKDQCLTNKGIKNIKSKKIRMDGSRYYNAADIRKLKQDFSTLKSNRFVYYYIQKIV